MASGQMTLDSAAVAAAVNEISVCIDDINTRNTKFLALLEEKNNATQNKFTLLKTLQTRIEEEAGNLQGAIAATEAIKDSIRKYEDMAAEVDDDADFRR